MRSRRAIALVARREITQRTRERSFLVSTVFTLVILAAIVVLPNLLGLDENSQTVAVASPQGERVARAAGPESRALGVDLSVERVASEQLARAMVEDGDADAALVGDGPTIVVQDEVDDSLSGALQNAWATLRTDAALAREGLDEAQRRAALSAPPLPIARLDERGDDQAQGLALIAVLLLFFRSSATATGPRPGSSRRRPRASWSCC